MRYALPIIALSAVTVLLFLASGCGTATAPNEKQDPLAEVSAQQIEGAFSVRASRVAQQQNGDHGVQVQFKGVDCTISHPGHATCFERVLFDAGYGSRITRTNRWEITYNAQGRLKEIQ